MEPTQEASPPEGRRRRNQSNGVVAKRAISMRGASDLGLGVQLPHPSASGLERSPRQLVWIRPGPDAADQKCL
ncbi:hypothetical protein CSAL01_00730 [Colletotrichum salicis]|uniref:Uncharacterized protein n=2 Tax=Colletotrichum acutatum species complex TaxID=2707335 RepID=A0A135S3L9_9PEZI|nr:hypothetical protein CSAL01_00730 [Colletotrichum salicis]